MKTLWHLGFDGNLQGGRGLMKWERTESLGPEGRKWARPHCINCLFTRSEGFRNRTISRDAKVKTRLRRFQFSSICPLPASLAHLPDQSPHCLPYTPGCVTSPSSAASTPQQAGPGHLRCDSDQRTGASPAWAGVAHPPAPVAGPSPAGFSVSAY